MSSKNSVWDTLNGLRRLITSRKFQNYKTGVFPMHSVVYSLVEHLEDDHEDILHECLLLLSACIPHLGKEIDSVLSEVLLKIAIHLGNDNPQIKLSVINFFYAYSRHTSCIQRFVNQFKKHAIENPDEKIKHGAVLCATTFPKPFLEEKLLSYSLANVFVSASPQLLYTVFHALKRIHKIVGNDEFYTYLALYGKNADKLYNDLWSGKHSSHILFPMGYSILDGCLLQPGSLDCEMKRYEVLYSIRSQIRSIGCSLIDLLPHVEHLVNFLGKLLAISSLRVRILSIDILEVIIERTKCEIVMHLDIFIMTLLKSLACFERRIRRQGISLIHRIMHYVHPMAVIQQLLQNIHGGNCIRSEIINRVTAGLFYYSCYSFDFNTLCSAISPFLEDTVLQVQQTSIECLVTIGYVLSMTGQSLDYFANYLKQSCRCRKNSVNIIISRIRKGLLPSCTAEGNVLHAKYQHVDTDSTMDISDDSCLTSSRVNSELWSHTGRKSVFTTPNELFNQEPQQYFKKETIEEQLDQSLENEVFAEKGEMCGKNELGWKAEQKRTLSVPQKTFLANKEISEDRTSSHILERHDTSSVWNICNKSNSQLEEERYFRNESSDQFCVKGANTTFSVTASDFGELSSSVKQDDFEKHVSGNESEISVDNVSCSTPENSELSDKDFVALRNNISPIPSKSDHSSMIHASPHSSRSNIDTLVNEEEQQSIASPSSIHNESSSMSQLSYVTSRDANSHTTADDASCSNVSSDGSGDANSFSSPSFAKLQECKQMSVQTQTSVDGNITMNTFQEINLSGAIMERLPPICKNFKILLIDEYIKDGHIIEEVSNSDDHSIIEGHISYPASETNLNEKKLSVSSKNCGIAQETKEKESCKNLKFSNKTCNALTLFKFPMLSQRTYESSVNQNRKDSQNEQSHYFPMTSNCKDVHITKTKLLHKEKLLEDKNLSICPVCRKRSNFHDHSEYAHDEEFLAQSTASETGHIRRKTYVLGQVGKNGLEKKKRCKKCESQMMVTNCVQENGTSNYCHTEREPVPNVECKVTTPKKNHALYKARKQASKLRSLQKKIGLSTRRNRIPVNNSRREKIPCRKYKLKRNVKMQSLNHRFIVNDANKMMPWLRKNSHFFQNDALVKENLGKVKGKMNKDISAREYSYNEDTILTASHVHHSPKAKGKKIQQNKLCFKDTTNQKISKNAGVASGVESVEKSLNIKSKVNSESKIKNESSPNCIEMSQENKDGSIDISDQNFSKLPPERRASDQWSSNIEFPRRSLNCPWADSFEQKIKDQMPFDSLDDASQVLKQICDSNLTDNDILQKEEYMLSIIRVAKFQPDLFSEYILNKILLNLLAEMKNLRPCVAGQAVLTIGYLYMLIKKPLESKLRVVMAALLGKSGTRTFAGSYNAVIKSLFYLLKGLPAQKAAIALILEGGRHPNKAVRETTAQFLSILTEKIGSTKCLMPNLCNLMLNAAAQFIVDGSPLTRHCGKLMFSVFVKHKNFDILKEKHLSDSVQMSILKILQSVSAKGVEKEILPINVIWKEDF